MFSQAHFLKKARSSNTTLYDRSTFEAGGWVYILVSIDYILNLMVANKFSLSTARNASSE